MKKKLLLVGLAILIIAQLFVPISMSQHNSKILKTGTAYKFRTAPVDPYDFMRGRYVALRYEQSSVAFNGDMDEVKEYSQLDGYASIGIDEEGFAFVQNITKEEPATMNYFAVKYRVSRRYNHDTKEKESPMSRFDFPIDRYYMNENDAPAAEKLYRDMNRRVQDESNGETQAPEHDTYMLVKILNGEMVLEELMIDDKPIREWLPK